VKTSLTNVFHKKIIQTSIHDKSEHRFVSDAYNLPMSIGTSNAPTTSVKAMPVAMFSGF
jgi:hypothetical protein